MRIGLIGWYGHQNAGDERILYCLKRFFVGHELLVTGGLEDACDKIDQLNRCDYILFGGGGLVLRGFNKFTNLIEQIKPRFGCVGISVEAYHKDNADFIQALKEKSEFILVRDYNSRELLDKHFKVIVSPDLTFLYPFEIIAPPKEEICAINLRPWYYWQCEHLGRKYFFMQDLNQKFPSLEKIYPFPKWTPKRAIDTAKANFSKVQPLPLYTEPNLENDISILSRYFGRVNPEFSYKDFALSRYIIGMRLHCLIFACQMGIPFLSLTYQPKNYEFCRSIGMEELSVDIFNLSEMQRVLDRLKSRYSFYRENLIQVRNKNHEEVKHVMNAIYKLVTGQNKKV